MDYNLIKEVIQLIEKFDTSIDSKLYSKDLAGFRRWIFDGEKMNQNVVDEPGWEGKENGRTPDSVINTLIVQMNRYAKTYSKSAIYNSKFTTQEDFIYLINLKAFGAMTKTDLIKKNIQEKPVGMQIINRLIAQGWIEQKDSLEDRRSKIIMITSMGIEALEQNMIKIKQATEIVTGGLSYAEKIELIKLLKKLEHFHQPIYAENIDPSQLIDVVYNKYLIHNN
ncbi:MarR family winged helix-turn-helix transcriptional regulator [Flavobacterium cerinum]|uniref:MarR family transcriptional regulator n=1 Tax=Flavobacterium cerinum TaxID=2502784 RepID=A0A444H0L2_9FLAO|nr:helix-turn-helix domain-containing protein [Flavobacterium cerinum]RWW96732.1 MarR family transcriptional regulator [Flavobacterium cerinum]